MRHLAQDARAAVGAAPARVGRFSAGHLPGPTDGPRHRPAQRRPADESYGLNRSLRRNCRALARLPQPAIEHQRRRQGRDKSRKRSAQPSPSHCLIRARSGPPISSIASCAIVASSSRALPSLVNVPAAVSCGFAAGKAAAVLSVSRASREPCPEAIA